MLRLTMSGVRHSWAKSSALRNVKKRSVTVISILGFAVIGTIVLTISHAATLPRLPIEAESGALGPHAARVIDATASGQGAIAFGQDAQPTTIAVNKFGSTNYYYVASYQYINSTGASADITQYQPDISAVSSTGGHSLIEVAVQDTTNGSVAELGWTVDKVTNGDLLPHIFVYHWVNGQTSCYNGCGFVSVSNTIKAGQAVTVGATANYKIEYSNSRWNYYYNNVLFGYFPGSLWSNTFTHTNLVQIFGEVATSGPTCVQMGNGQLGGKNASAQVSNVAFSGATIPSNLIFDQTINSNYEYSWTTSNSFHLGGPGVCTGSPVTPNRATPNFLGPQSTQVAPPGGGALQVHPSL